MKRRGSFCLLLSAVSVLFLLGGGRACAADETGSRAETEESVLFSNIRFDQDDLSEEERTMMDSVHNMLKHAEYRSNTQEFTVSNTTGKEIDEICFIFLFYNKEDTLVYSDRLWLENWPADERIEAALSPSRRVDTGRSAEYDRLDAAVRYSYGSHYYQTAAVPIDYTEEDGGEKVALHLTEDTPFSVSFSDSTGETETFTVTDVRCIKDWIQDRSLKGQYYLRIILTKDSGSAAGGGTLEWRVVREEDRAVMNIGTVNLRYMHEGEQYTYQSAFFELDPGSYIFEILEEM